ncbi:uncharacterized protein VICG_01265 [Vittaforma corneae ATCC 50505]|uniref:Homeobox domain-containing protein n=1 Tax=Vittaforma corneae (strain ATCC 50505) TaxID=993615 RepID=L2GLP0_VITCO|nr:uncharacterized protein VICG_01265 [Vittaforma corneae ATCC 50505]ELA41761.1 hypothetical protein VICG_01265 [Vittaforma corneae ATCC 50505]
MTLKADQDTDVSCKKARENNLEALLGLMKLKRGELLSSSRKVRTHKNDFQKAVLVDVFAITKFPSSDTREDLALILNHTSRSIQIWFQNNRHSISSEETCEIRLKFGIDSDEETNSKKRTIDRYLLGKILETHLSDRTKMAWDSFINYIPLNLE